MNTVQKMAFGTTTIPMEHLQHKEVMKMEFKLVCGNIGMKMAALAFSSNFTFKRDAAQKRVAP